jgi:uncharacterized protein DUF5681
MERNKSSNSNSGQAETALSVHPSSRADHIKAHRFKPGVSGNPRGRPKGVFKTAALRHLRKKLASGDTQLDAVVDSQIQQAMKQGKGSTLAATFLRDTVDGKPGVDGEDGSGSKDVTINIMWGGSEPAWTKEPRGSASGAIEIPASWGVSTEEPASEAASPLAVADVSEKVSESPAKPAIDASQADRSGLSTLVREHPIDWPK